MKKEILITGTDLEKFMTEGNYIDFCEYVKTKGKFDEGFWLIAEEAKEGGLL